jgi:glycosyltransferase involved in cell wall biosynthesis
MAVGPTHVTTVDGEKNARSSDDLPGVASVSSLFSEHITPRGMLARRLSSGLRLLTPGYTYAPDPAFRAALLDQIRRDNIDTVIFRYTHLYCVAGLTQADGVRVIVDVDDRDDQKYHTRLIRLLGPRLANHRLGQVVLNRLSKLLKSRLSQANHVWFATNEDIWPLGNAKVSVLPNVAYETPALDGPTPSTCAQTLLFVGIFNHLPNRDGVAWFLKNCWPYLISKCPDARLRIVGRGDWASMAVQFPNIKNVDFVGEVDDLAPEYHAARMAICPVREGGGSKIKVLEAASYGRPVMATSHSLRGFDGLQINDLSQADDPRDFADGCVQIITDPKISDQMGTALCDWQRANYSKQSFVEKVAQVLRP